MSPRLRTVAMFRLAFGFGWHGGGGCCSRAEVARRSMVKDNTPVPIVFVINVFLLWFGAYSGHIRRDGQLGAHGVVCAGRRVVTASRARRALGALPGAVSASVARARPRSFQTARGSRRPVPK